MKRTGLTRIVRKSKASRARVKKTRAAATVQNRALLKLLDAALPRAIAALRTPVNKALALTVTRERFERLSDQILPNSETPSDVLDTLANEIETAFVTALDTLAELDRELES